MGANENLGSSVFFAGDCAYDWTTTFFGLSTKFLFPI